MILVTFMFFTVAIVNMSILMASDEIKGANRDFLTLWNMVAAIAGCCGMMALLAP